MAAKQNSDPVPRNSLFAERFLRLIRLYTFNTPIDKGKYRLFIEALKLVGNAPDGMAVETKDGRKFSADLSTGMQSTLYFLGEYEKAITSIVEGILRKQARKQLVFIDAGANFGWYTTLFAKYAGTEGEVHSFEPVPTTFANLERNFALMDNQENVRINNLALGDEEKELTINVFKGLPTGHASLSTQDRDDAIPFKCRMITLDSYLEENNVGDVDFVKVDIEGAELGMLKGAERLFKQERPPIMLMEMALNQTKNFGYFPNDLIEFLSQRAPYNFYKIDEIKGELNEIEGFARDDIGANVICVPKNED